MRKLDIIRRGGKCVGYTYQTPTEYYREKELELEAQKKNKRQKKEKDDKQAAEDAEINIHDATAALEEMVSDKEEDEKRGTSDVPENADQEKEEKKLQNESDIMRAFGKVKEKSEAAANEVDDDSKTKKVTLGSTFAKPSKRQAKASRKKASARKGKQSAFSGSDEPSMSDNDYAFDSTSPESKSSMLKMMTRGRKNRRIVEDDEGDQADEKDDKNDDEDYN